MLHVKVDAPDATLQAGAVRAHPCGINVEVSPVLESIGQVHAGALQFLDEFRSWIGRVEIDLGLNRGALTPNLLQDFQRFLEIRLVLTRKAGNKAIRQTN